MNTYPTRTLPTDKNGNIYYGPTTMAQAAEQINDGRPAAQMAEIMESAGYAKIARSIRKDYGVGARSKADMVNIRKLAEEAAA